jgi:flagellar biosynthesis protein FlhF
MQIHTFVAESAADAISQIRETLGPEAVVLNVRRPPVEGLARLWQKPRIEVLAHVPEAMVAPASPDMLAELREELREIRDKINEPKLPEAEVENGARRWAQTQPQPEEPVWNTAAGASHTAAVRSNAGGWRIGALLENGGLLPLHAQRVVEELLSLHGDAPPDSVAEEIQLARLHLAKCWKPARETFGGTHVLVGAPGAGKTTALCKWLAQVALVQSRSAAVWRLDSHVANTAESLSVFGEILGVPVERFAPANGELPEADVLFVDLPGVNPADSAAMSQLSRRIAELPDAQVHLVLNAAYETPLLLAQVRAFSRLAIGDVVVTHLDEESRWGKLWNLVLGTNCTLRFLSAGQNIPGDFAPATAERILARQFPRKPVVI